ncbi:MAG: hypothetical protein OXF90_11025, partial [Chloroflexi bacterium]|nr:hypothetical protein [Chloroflexota bacterium]
MYAWSKGANRQRHDKASFHYAARIVENCRQAGDCASSIIFGLKSTAATSAPSLACVGRLYSRWHIIAPANRSGHSILMTETVIFALVGILVGFSKGGLGGPVPVALTVPMLALIIEPQVAVALVLPLLLFADAFALYFYWGLYTNAHFALDRRPTPVYTKCINGRGLTWQTAHQDSTTAKVSHL